MVDGPGPIGVFDSGVGGLSILHEIRRELPQESVVYVADSGFAPYGDRDAEFIEQRARAIVRFLLSQGVKAVVIACNTATGVAVEHLRQCHSLPIVAIEPAVKPAAALTRSGIVGVMATSATLASQRFAHLVDKQGTNVRVLTQPCPGLVPRVEAGEHRGATTRALLEQYVAPLLSQGADTLVLGCTHYTFLTPLIKEIVGEEVTIVDPAPAVARELRRRLRDANLLNDAAAEHPVRTDAFWSSGDLGEATRVLGQLWAPHTTVRLLPPEYCASPPTHDEHHRDERDSAT